MGIKNKTKMKTFAICLLVTSALGAKFLGNEDNIIEDEGDYEIDIDEGDYPMRYPYKERLTGLDISNSQTIDLTSTYDEELKYDVTTGGELEFIVDDNPSMPFVLKYFTHSSLNSNEQSFFKVSDKYVQDQSCGRFTMGCGGARHLNVQAGNEEGTDVLYVCRPYVDDTNVDYDVMLE